MGRFASEIFRYKAIIEAYLNGEVIQEYDPKQECWVDVECPVFNFGLTDYRIKSKVPPSLPWTSKTCPNLCGTTLKSRKSSVEYLVVGVARNSEFVTLGGGLEVSFEELLDNFTFMDGTLCGDKD